MNDKPWMKMFTEARNDAKLRSLTDAQHRVWFRLILLAAEQPQSHRGTIGPIRIDLLALEVSERDEALLLETLDILVSLCCVEVDHGALRSATRALTVQFVRFAQRQKCKPSETPERKNARAAKSRANKRIHQSQSNNGAPVCASAAPPVAPSAPKRRLDSSSDDSSESSSEEPPYPPKEGGVNGKGEDEPFQSAGNQIPTGLPADKQRVLDRQALRFGSSSAERVIYDLLQDFSAAIVAAACDYHYSDRAGSLFPKALRGICQAMHAGRWKIPESGGSGQFKIYAKPAEPTPPLIELPKDQSWKGPSYRKGQA